VDQNFSVFVRKQRTSTRISVRAGALGWQTIKKGRSLAAPAFHPRAIAAWV
jgi:hypothetical protein